MDLIQKIQDSIVDSSKNINDILRLRKILANFLKNVEFKNWINFELNGYPFNDRLHDYRIIPYILQGDIIGILKNPLEYNPLKRKQTKNFWLIFLNNLLHIMTFIDFKFWNILKN